MKKISQIILATAAVLLTSGFAHSQTVDNNWQAGGNLHVRSGADSSLCWNNNFWTPATATAECGGPKPVAEVMPPKAAPAPTPTPPAPPVVSNSKITFLADALFDFDKSVLKPEGIAKLNDLIGKLKQINTEVIIVVGHTDNIGTAAYNKKLSVRRAEAVKAYFMKNGIEASKVFTEGKGFAEPVSSNKTSTGRAINRRAVIEVVGSKK